ncbi:hypothetical protein P879_06802 [Paragonimus westermani]|uniref:Leishmanolysin-like peptidase n=1 Tax=Paragonimus westermani TaxID=34504 RepID=A0A8T0DP74_9TREM|nr:hypothetical protein P879_06802 [Paragonimus westermani]
MVTEVKNPDWMGVDPMAGLNLRPPPQLNMNEDEGLPSGPGVAKATQPRRYSVCAVGVNEPHQGIRSAEIELNGITINFQVDSGAGVRLVPWSCVPTAPAMNNPILGYVNLCTRAIVSDSGLNERAYSIFLHEIAHALGFSPTLYAFLRNENGEPRTRRNPLTQLPDLGFDSNGLYTPGQSTMGTVVRIWKSVKGTFNRKVKVLKTPMLLATAREHFNCPTLDGVDLENQGSESTAMAHFEKRLVMVSDLDTTFYQTELLWLWCVNCFNDLGRSSFSLAEVGYTIGKRIENNTTFLHTQRFLPQATRDG